MTHARSIAPPPVRLFCPEKITTQEPRYHTQIHTLGGDFRAWHQPQPRAGGFKKKKKMCFPTLSTAAPQFISTAGHSAFSLTHTPSEHNTEGTHTQHRILSWHASILGEVDSAAHRDTPPMPHQRQQGRVRQHGDEVVPSSSARSSSRTEQQQTPPFPTTKTARLLRREGEGCAALAPEDAKRPRAVSPPSQHWVPLSPGSSIQTGASSTPLGSPQVRSIYSLAQAKEKRSRPRRDRGAGRGNAYGSSNGGGRALCFDNERDEQQQDQVREAAGGRFFCFLLPRIADLDRLFVLQACGSGSCYWLSRTRRPGCRALQRLR